MYSLTTVMAWKRRESQTKSMVFLANPLYSELRLLRFFLLQWWMDEQDFLLAQNQLLEEVHQPLCRRQSPQVWEWPEPLESSQAREVQHLSSCFKDSGGSQSSYWLVQDVGRVDALSTEPGASGTALALPCGTSVAAWSKGLPPKRPQLPRKKRASLTDLVWVMAIH